MALLYCLRMILSGLQKRGVGLRAQVELRIMQICKLSIGSTRRLTQC